MNKLIANLNLTVKFAIIALITTALFMPPLIMVVNTLLAEEAFTEREISGLDASRSLIKVLRLTQVHRSQAAGALAGKSEVEASRLKTQRKIDRAIKEATEKLLVDLDHEEMQSHWGELSKEWQALARDVSSTNISANTSQHRHEALIERYLHNHDDLLDYSQISLEPNATEYFLQSAVLNQLPHMTEILGELGSLGGLLLARHHATPEERTKLNSLIHQSEQALQGVERTFKKTYERDPSLHQIFDHQLNQVRAESQKLIDMTINNIIKQDGLTAKASEYIQLSANDIKHIFDLIEVGTNQFEERLQARYNHDVAVSWQLFLFFSCLISVGLWFGIAISNQVVSSATTARDAAKRVAKGDLSIGIPGAGKDEMGQLLKAMSEMQISLGGVVQRVRENADSVAVDSAEIANGNLDLSNRTEQQAAALEETTASMHEMDVTVKRNAENASQANDFAVGASDIAAKGSETVDQVIDTMKEINDSSSQIANIINVIEGIAFQTNILALNAAVEAARAGEQGRGFAVVATEVRNLAQRSSRAATEIKTLINTSVERVELGSQLVNSAGAIIAEMVTATKNVTDIMTDISAATREQSTNVAHISQAVNHMDQSTQQNAALVEQSAAASHSLKIRASGLVDVVAVFKLPA